MTDQVDHSRRRLLTAATVGTGAIGDMACHTMNLAFMALNLGAPSSIIADLATPLNPETAPEGCTVTCSRR